jgi:hypothetical protein
MLCQACEKGLMQTKHEAMFLAHASFMVNADQANVLQGYDRLVPLVGLSKIDHGDEFPVVLFIGVTERLMNAPLVRFRPIFDLAVFVITRIRIEPDSHAAIVITI